MSTEEPEGATTPREEEGEQNPVPEEWGEDISPDKDGGIFKKILTPGAGSETPMPGCEVFVPLHRAPAAERRSV